MWQGDGRRSWVRKSDGLTSGEGSFLSTRSRAWLSVFLALVLSLTLPTAMLASAPAGDRTGAQTSDSSGPTPVAASAVPASPTNASGTPLPAGSVHSTIAPTVGSVATQAIEPTLVRSPGAYVYVTSFGNYSFPKNMPLVMMYNTTDGSQMASWSAFLVGASMPGLAIPMVPRNTTVLGASNYSLGFTSNPTYLGISQGTVTTWARFSAYAPPKFTVNFTQANSSNLAFNILWFVLPAFPYLNENGSAVD